MSSTQYKAPTCTASGYKAYETCKNCDYSTFEVIPATGHKNVIIKGTSNATCVSDGYTGDTFCDDCNTIIENGSVIPSTGIHSGGKGTCTKKAVCDVCGSEYGSIDPDNHADLYSVNAKAPTCTEKGWFSYDTCRECGYSTYVELPMYGHDLVFHEGKSPTLTEPGYTEYNTCTKCDYTTYTELPILEFIYGDVNHDEKINLTDVSLILKHIANWEITIDTNAADVNCGGKINLTDVSLILKYIARWDVTLGNA